MYNKQVITGLRGLRWSQIDLFTHVGLREQNETYSVQICPVVGVTTKQGPDYSSDAAIVKAEEESEVEESDVTLMVQVKARPMQGV